MLLNRLASTSVRMQDAPETAAEELAGYDARLAAAVAMHTAAEGKANGTRGLPSAELQAVLKAWLA